ncbi:hypothetical protein GZH53_15740 [Flavihumibacter sp. R14]|nr:hypothetical protein [Flavihumibacter soli]
MINPEGPNTTTLSSNEINQLLNQVDISLIEEAKKLHLMAECMEFIPIQEFTLDSQTKCICHDEYNLPGVYLFEIKVVVSTNIIAWMTDFTNLWRDVTFSWVPGIKNVRVKSHKELKDWMPIYIGKSKRVASRVNDHLLKSSAATTFAMKLKERTNLYGNTFRISWIPMDVRNYNMIVPAIESALRNRYNPIIGRQ